MDDVRTYESPPRRPQSWWAKRPGDLSERQPSGPYFGRPGPDQGYALTLARAFHDKLSLRDGEREEDAIVGCVAVATKRASLFGRAPVIHDLRAAFTIWGFLDDQATQELLDLRRPLFAEVSLPDYYIEQRRIAAVVPDEVLRRTHDRIATDYAADWRSLLDFSVLE
jgi:hypothetical protein